MKKVDLMKFADKVQQFKLVRAIRDGLVNIIPVLIIGAFALVLKTFPIQAYQDFIASFLNGFLFNLFNLINTATFGVLSLYMTFAISRAYMKIKADADIVHGGAIIASLISFFMLSGTNLAEFKLENMGPKSMLLAILAGTIASELYSRFFKWFKKKISKGRILSSGADHEFNRMMATLVPIVLVVMIFALADLIIINVFNKSSFHELYIAALNKIFSSKSAGFIKGFFFVLLSSTLWFFGVHGSDALEGVMQAYFPPFATYEAGANIPILTKEFFDCFVLMGGCGTAISLLIAIVLFSKNRARRGLGYTAALPLFFNINELIVFGLPIIFNPIMLIPFLTVPLVCYTTSYLAVFLGLVPHIASSVEWTTPIILGGFYATNSIAGALLQLANVVIGVAIYFPFIRILDKQSIAKGMQNYEAFMKYYKENEASLQTVNLIELNNVYGDFAKELCADLRHDLFKMVKMYYQPQYNYEGKCVGVEALLRWQHHTYGMIYPPLVIKLAAECGLLAKLEEKIFRFVLEENDKIVAKFGDIKISVNITGPTIIKPEFKDFLSELNVNGTLKEKKICIEITEQTALEENEETLEALKFVHSLGIALAIDDFSMGKTSLQYIKYGIFDILKIDGSLVKGLNRESNCREIISSITDLTSSLSMQVIAEFVETEQEKEILHSIHCDNYQGYLYSPAVALE